MNYNNGGLFGYDQVFVGPLCESYKDYDRKSINKYGMNFNDDRFANGGGQHVRGKESFTNYRDDRNYRDYDRLATHGGQHVRGRANFTATPINYNSVHDYLNQAAVSSDACHKRENIEAELNKAKKKLYGYKYRHDMMFIFITCLFIIIIIQYSVHMNTISSLQWNRHPAYMPHQSPYIESSYLA
jgi:hypothetical protein